MNDSECVVVMNGSECVVVVMNDSDNQKHYSNLNQLRNYNVLAKNNYCSLVRHACTIKCVAYSNNPALRLLHDHKQSKLNQPEDRTCVG